MRFNLKPANARERALGISLAREGPQCVRRAHVARDFKSLAAPRISSGGFGMPRRSL